jgi:predicted O-methyltransferase YrrM
MNLIKGNPTEYYELTLQALQWVSYDPYIDSLVSALHRHIRDNDASFWNVHVALCYLSKITDPQYYLEIGTRRGRSLFQVLCNSNPKRVVSIDLYIESSFADLKKDVDKFLQETKRTVDIVYYKERSDSALKKLKDGKDRFDLILIDGSHEHDDAVKDLSAAHQLLTNKGVLVFDDVGHMPHLMDVVMDFKRDHRDFELIHTDQFHGCAVLYRGIQL